MKNQGKHIVRRAGERSEGKVSVSTFKDADVIWARETVARYRDPEYFRAELAEQAKLREREKTRQHRTRAFWRELRKCLQVTVSCFNAEWGEEFVRCQKERDRFSLALPPSMPLPPFNEPADAVQVSLIYDRKLLLFHLRHSDRPQNSAFALRPDLGGSHGALEVCIISDKNGAVPFMTVTPEEAAKHVVECLLRL